MRLAAMPASAFFVAVSVCECSKAPPRDPERTAGDKGDIRGELFHLLRLGDQDRAVGMMHLTARNHDLDLFVSGKCDRLLFPGIFQGLLGVFRRPRIGGTSLAGGRGTILGALIGGCFMGVVQNAITILAISAYWEQVITGIIILIAIAIDCVKSKRLSAA